MVFEFRYRSMAMLQAQGIVPPSKREVPPVIDVEDDDTLPPRKRQKAGQKGDTVRSMQVRNSLHTSPLLSPNDEFGWIRQSSIGCGAG